MRITKYGHACLLVEADGVRVLIDPGSFSSGFEDLTGLDAILITHQHPDHLNVEAVAKLVTNSPEVAVYADEASAKLLEEGGVEAKAVHHGDVLELDGTTIQVVGQDHAVIHPDVPVIPNVGYLVGESFFYPGDAFTEPGQPVAVLGTPVGAPWLKLSEAVDYVRAVKPKVAVPVHDAVLAMPQMNSGLLATLTKEQGIEVRVIENGTSAEF